MRLVLKSDGQEYVFNKKDVTIGRSSDNDICIDNEAVSARHATLHQAESGSTILADMNSTNGVFVNDKRVLRHKLGDGDIISIGRQQMVFHNDTSNSAEISNDQSEATVIMSADFQEQLQEELNKKKVTAVVTHQKENNLWQKIKQLFGF